MEGFDNFFKALQDIAHQDWFTRIAVAIFIALITYVVARIAVIILQGFFRRGRGPLPKNSIFFNLIKLFIWIIGASVLLGVCFNIDLSAILTALGVGGIAVSLGFQATLSNLIGGLEVSISKIFVPGDNVQIGAMNLRGVVKDVTWRHTTITDYSGNEIIVPNSVMNTQSLVVLLPPNHINIPIVVNTTTDRLSQVAAEMEQTTQTAVEAVDKLENDPQILFSEVTDLGVKGTMSFVIADADKAGAATDACIRAITPLAHTLIAGECVTHGEDLAESDEKAENEDGVKSEAEAERTKRSCSSSEG